MIKTGVRDEFEQVESQINWTINRIWSRHFGAFQAVETWTPAINVYQLSNGIDVCVDLSGIEPRSIEVQLSQGRLTISGVRHAPDPRSEVGQSMRIVSMEIDHGPFSRTIQLPETIDLATARTEYVQGLLWIRMLLTG